MDRAGSTAQYLGHTFNSDIVVNMEEVIRDGRRSYFFHGAGRGRACPKLYGAGNPPFPTVRGGAGKGSKSTGHGGAGAAPVGRGTYWLKSYAAEKEILICIALGEFNLLNIHNIDRNHKDTRNCPEKVMKISHFNPNQSAPSIYIMIELCYFSLDQWEIRIHLLWGKSFNIPLHCDPHLNQTKWLIFNDLLP